ncbi:MAG TPA: metallophosphoesterase [Steroidobacteraceae bacterium]|nr:metallophosphoesterase [Steroidobacteraceae bacterium]
MDTDKGQALSGNPLRFAHLSDLHLPHEPRLRPLQHFSKRQLSVWSWRRRRAVQSPVVLAALRAEMSAHRPDHILVTGDITNFSLPGEFTAAATWLEQLPAPASIVPGNHDALVPVPLAAGLGKLVRWSAAGEWPFVRRQGRVSAIGLNSAVPTAPLLASGRLGRKQIGRLARVLAQEREAGQLRILMLHHPVADGAVSARKALRDRRELRAVLREQGAELVLHGHARNARLDALPGPAMPIPCLCVPSSTALPNPHDEAARWHLLELPAAAGGWARVLVRQWSVDQGGFVDAARYELRLGP